MTRLPVAVAALVTLLTLTTFSVTSAVSGTARAQIMAARPSVSGAAKVGRTLQASTGSWRGRSISYSFEWQRCAGAGGSCRTIEGATGSFYLIRSADAGAAVRVVVTARNRTGVARGISARSKAIRSSSTRGAHGALRFDGRAKRMKALASTGRVSALRQSQSPRTWTCLCFEKNDISLASDSAYGKAYKATVPVGDHNPWNTAAPSSDGAAQMSIRRSNDLGKWDYYAFAVKVPSWSGSLSDIKFVTLLSVGYQTAEGDQLGLGLINNNGSLAFQVHQNAGYVNSPNAWQNPSVAYKAALMPVVYGQWREFVLAVKWATNNTGAVQVYSRAPGGSWAKVFERLNEPTYIYGTTMYGNFAADGSNWPTVIDKLGLYYGQYTTRPTQTVYESGLTRSSDLATAQSTLP